MKNNKNTFFISHEFDAPVEKVFAAWTDVEHLKNWFAPEDYSIVFSRADIRPGGECHYCLVSKHGMEMWNKIFYKEIIPPARIVYTMCFSNEEGGIEKHPMIKNWPLEILSTIMLDEIHGKTTLKLTWEPLNASIEEITKFSDGIFELNQEWGGVFGQLENYLVKIKSSP